jgi:Meiotically up-regulated gene 113
MTQRGTDPNGTFTCGCGARVTVQVTERPRCARPDCHMVPVREASSVGLPLCAEHFAELGQLFESLRIAELETRQVALDHQEAALANRELEVRLGLQQWDINVHKSRQATRQLDELRWAGAAWQVYYMRIGDCIKIGTTRSMKKRISDLQPDEVLAVEPGDRTVERERHRQFAHLRVRGERFRVAPDLLAHIKAIHDASDPAGPLGGTPLG